MTIGELAKRSGVNAKLIRHYESINLVAKAKRSESGYRTYRETDIEQLMFIKRARSLGFPIKDISALLTLWKNKARTSRAVKAIAMRQVDLLEEKIRVTQAMLVQLRGLTEHCRGDERSNCPILESFTRGE